MSLKAQAMRAAARKMLDDNFYRFGPVSSTFLVEIDGEPIGRFTEARGLEVSIDVEEVEEGGENSFVHKLPGRMRWPNITLVRGITQTNNLFEWLQLCGGEGFAGNGNIVDRSTAAITLMSSQGIRLRSWDIDGAIPIRWSGPDFTNASDDILTEELEIAHHGFRAPYIPYKLPGAK